MHVEALKPKLEGFLRSNYRRQSSAKPNDLLGLFPYPFRRSFITSGFPATVAAVVTLANRRMCCWIASCNSCTTVFHSGSSA